jgi:SAM-dependent methyltransferase
MAVYDVLAPHYDAVTGDSTTEGALVRDVIDRCHGRVATLLDVGCGTGSITVLLADKYQVSGLDISSGMLDAARGKLPEGTPLYLADMARFKLDVKFDAVVCAYQGVNHLLAFPAWKSFFGCVWEHLNDGGVFIFDIITVSGLVMMSSIPEIIQKFGDNYLLIRVRRAEEMVFRWQIEVFELQPDGSYRLLAETVETRSFPVDSIREALRPRFINIETIGGDGRPAGEDGAERIWIVCTKPAASPSRTRR